MFINIIANSKRHDILEKRLIDDGYKVQSYKSFDDLPDKLDGDITVLPIPTFKADGKFNLPNSPDSFKKNSLCKLFNNDSLVITCNTPLDEKRFIDINKYEPFVSLNANPSAEGAIALAMQNTDCMIFNSKSLVIGYGRIGKLLALKLFLLGADVTVVARNPKDRLAATSLGMSSLDYNELNNRLGNFDFVFQTVPYPVLDKSRLDLINNALIIELSSGGIGTDIDYAKRINKRIIYAPGIPEKYCSYTAGIILYDSIKSIMREI